MNGRNIYLLCAGVTTCLTFVGSMLQAVLPGAGERPLAPSSMEVKLGNCRLAGVIAETDNKVFAEFEAVNSSDTDAKLDFYYSVDYTPSMSPMSRMMPMPHSLTNGRCSMVVKAGTTSQVERIFVRNQPAGTQVDSTKTLGGGNDLKDTPEHWVLAVSREEMKTLGGWGGLPPVATTGMAMPEKGTVVLASSATPKLVVAKNKVRK